LVISAELSAKILRLHKAEHWRVGTIARQLHVHRDTVRRVLAQAGEPAPASPLRPSRVDPYRAFILQTLDRFPTLTAARLFAMVHERGYRGSQDHFRHVIAGMRPRRAAQAYLRLRTLPGEQAQVDWAHFGHLQIGRARRPLMAFVMVLSHSRRIFLKFFLNARLDSFLRGHAQAFIAYGGVPRVLRYDNLKSAVLERMGEAIRFNPELLTFAAHLGFEPRPVGIARGNEKGRVERAIRYIREAFFAGREFTDLEDLNAQARVWCQGPASDRPWPEGGAKSVRQAFDAERASLMPLPDREYPLGERLAVQVGKTPYVRFGPAGASRELARRRAATAAHTLDARAGAGRLRVPARTARAAMGAVRVRRAAGLARADRAATAVARVRSERTVLTSNAPSQNKGPHCGALVASCASRRHQNRILAAE
jgi:transposase